MSENEKVEVHLRKSDLVNTWWRSTFLQASWNYERMQNVGWAFSLIPGIRRLYKSKEDRAAAMKRHLEFFNTHPYGPHLFWVLSLLWKSNVQMVRQLMTRL